MQLIGIEYVRSSMVLAENLVDKNGAVLVPKGSPIDEDTIVRIIKAGYPYAIMVEDDINVRALMEEEVANVSDEIKSQVEGAFSKVSTSEFHDMLKLLAIKYRSRLYASEN